jgi:hypothetical protein
MTNISVLCGIRTRESLKWWETSAGSAETLVVISQTTRCHNCDALRLREIIHDAVLAFWLVETQPGECFLPAEVMEKVWVTLSYFHSKVSSLVSAGRLHNNIKEEVKMSGISKLSSTFLDLSHTGPPKMWEEQQSSCWNDGRHFYTSSKNLGARGSRLLSTWELTGTGRE